MRRRCHRNRRQRRVVALLDEASHERREAAAVDRTEVERHRPARGDLPRDDVPRRQLVREAVALLVQKQGALAAKCLRQQEGGIDERRGMELDELEIRERRARPVGGRSPFSHGARGVGRPLPQRRGTAGRQERGSSGDCATIGDDTYAALVVAPDREHPLALCDSDPWMRENALGELSSNPVPGRGASGVDDAPPAVAALEPEAVVEIDPELDEIADARRRLFGEHRDRARATQAAAGPQCVLRVERRGVVLPDGSCDPALREQARRCEQRALGQDEHLALRGRAQRREEARHPAADHDECELRVVARIQRFAHGSFRL